MASESINQQQGAKLTKGKGPGAPGDAQALQDAANEDAPAIRYIRFMVIDDKGVEFHLRKPESVLMGILDPTVPDCFIEVAVPDAIKGSVKRNFMHTSRIAHLYVHDEINKPVED